MALTTSTPLSLSSSSTPLSLSSSSTLIGGKAPRQSASASSQCVTLPTLPPPPVQSQSRTWKTTAYCPKLARNVVARVTREAPTEIAATEVTETELPEIELPEIAKTIQEAWDKVEDKYAVTSLGVAGIVALWGCTGLISAIDSLPLVPSVLELVGIGYTGWFAYQNLVFKPDREALIQKIKGSYGEITGKS